MILETMTKIPDQDMTSLNPQVHKVARTVMIDCNLRTILAHNTLLNALNANASLAQRMLKHVRE